MWLKNSLVNFEGKMRQHNELVISILKLHTSNVHINTFFELSFKLLQYEIT